MTKTSRLISTLALGLALAGAPAMATSDVFVSEAGGSISFSTAKTFGTAKLLVSGPDGFQVEQTFVDGETIGFSIHDGFEAVQDGSYSWSLTVTSVIGDELRAQMDEARAVGDDRFMDRAREAGLFESHTYTGAFARKGGQLVLAATEADFGDDRDIDTKDQVFADDLIVQGSACVGVDCANGENFGFDTLRLKENNLRIKFDDTSASASFPNVDWQLTANDSSNGGKNRFSIEDVTNNKNAFTIEANAEANTLYVEEDGDVGIKTSEPVVDLHIVEGNTPTLRLEQDGSDGFQAQTWDVAGNEANFFVRDVTNSSKLPFRIKPTAPDDSIFIDADGDVGMGTKSPGADLHVVGADNNLQLLLEGDGPRVQMQLKNSGATVAGGDGQTWRFDVNSAGNFTIIDVNNTVNALQIDPISGNTRISGTLTATVGGTNLTFPDYVFEDGYDLMPLHELASFIEAKGHLPRIPSAEEVEGAGEVNMSKLQLQLLEKIEELTLYTLAQEETIKKLEERLNAVEGK